MRNAQDIAVVVATGVIVAAATAVFSLYFEPRRAVVGFIALFWGSTTALGAVVWWKRDRLWALPATKALVIVVVLAALFRMAALVAPVSLSDDIWRYVWDGEIVAAAESPYAASATDRHAGGDGDPELYDKLNRPDAHTVYPPLSQAVFASAVLLSEAAGGSAQRWLRGLFSLFDIAGVALLCLVLIGLGRSPMWAALYAWHPLAFWEVAAGGHTEALGIVWLVAIVGLAVSGRGLWTGVAIGLAGLAKWTFLAVSPVVAFFLLKRRGWWAAIAATVAALAVVIGGYLTLCDPQLVEHHLESIGLYAADFSFNAPVYYLIRWLGGYREGVTEPIHHITRPLLTVATVGAIAAAAWWQDGSKRRLLAGVVIATAAYVVFSPTFHPWYALPLLVAGALAGWTTPAVLGAVIAVSYSFYAPWMSPGGEVALMAFQSLVVGGWFVWEAGPPFVDWLLRRRARRKADVVRRRLDGGESILDLGAGEGYVGRELADDGHHVELADVADMNKTDLRSTVYDGRNLPFEDDQFDAVVISYVLHHADEPEAVLDEALRVGRRVVILETVYEEEWDRRLVTVLDHGANALRGMAPEPLKLGTAESWIERIESMGGDVEDWQWLGRGLHRHVMIAAGRPRRDGEG